MERLNPDKLYVEFSDVTYDYPIANRRYTLTHSDETADLFLDIGREFAFEKINPTRDEVLGEWVCKREKFVFMVYIYIDNGEYNKDISLMRNSIFIRELPLALEAIRYGDRRLFDYNKKLDRSPIFVFFRSAKKELNRVEHRGSFNNYI